MSTLCIASFSLPSAACLRRTTYVRFKTRRNIVSLVLGHSQRAKCEEIQIPPRPKSSKAGAGFEMLHLVHPPRRPLRAPRRDETTCYVLLVIGCCRRCLGHSETCLSFFCRCTEEPAIRLEQHIGDRQHCNG